MKNCVTRQKDVTERYRECFVLKPNWNVIIVIIIIRKENTHKHSTRNLTREQTNKNLQTKVRAEWMGYEQIRNKNNYAIRIIRRESLTNPTTPQTLSNSKLCAEFAPPCKSHTKFKKKKKKPQKINLFSLSFWSNVYYWRKEKTSFERNAFFEREKKTQRERESVVFVIVIVFRFSTLQNQCPF